MNSGLQHISNVYFLGVGGIGMSALARYFRHLGKNVAGYDLTGTSLTSQLSSEGIQIHYTDDIRLVPPSFEKENTLVVYTPAVPADFGEYNWLKSKGFTILKRAKVLGMLCSEGSSIAVAGTHGKTTVSTMATVIIKESSVGCGAFLGGISKNYGTNLVLPNTGDKWLVAEADEYDRSFLNLFPNIGLVTAVDPDHLDIYGTYQEIVKAFTIFVNQIKKGGTLILKKGIGFCPEGPESVKTLTYSLFGPADYFAQNIRPNGDGHIFDLATPGEIIKDINLSYPGLLNVENAVAAAALSLEAGVSASEVQHGLSVYQGVKRRFDIRFRNEKILFIDDYAHHPKELEATITSVRKLYPTKKITGIFQPHLFSRTNDLAEGFAQSLCLLDLAILLPIYPAREKPIEGVTSELIAEKMGKKAPILMEKKNVAAWVLKNEPEILITLGAGDIDKTADELTEVLKRRYHV